VDKEVRFSVSMDGACLDYDRLFPGAYCILTLDVEFEFRNQGRATQLLDVFFSEIVAKDPATVWPGYYSYQGRRYIRKVVHRLADKYRIQIHEE